MSSGAEKIVDKIISDSNTKADNIIKEAEEKAKTIIEESKINAQQKENQILENAKKEANIRQQQIISDAKLNSKRKIQESREELMVETLDKATKELEQIAATSPEYKDSLIKLTKEAALEIGGGSLEILLKKGDAEKVENTLKTIEDEVSQKTGTPTTIKIGPIISTIGGVKLKTTDGNIEVDNTIEARLERFRSMLRLDVAKVLFD
jgi:V/A-type H+-transporting ATPase subunit E